MSTVTLGPFALWATESLSPPRLRGVWGTKWVTAFAAEYDWMQDWFTKGVQARYPSKSPPDGLALIGWERQIQRSPGESDANYAGRLLSAWKTWEWSGTGPGILAGIDSCGIPALPAGLGPDWPLSWPETGYVWLVPYRCLWRLPFRVPNDSARFWVVIDWYAVTNGDVSQKRGEPGFVRDAWGVRGLNMLEGAMRSLKASIAKWKGAGETCIGILFITTNHGIGAMRFPLWTRGNSGKRGGRLVYIGVEEIGYHG